jgi:hypothetical protein
MQQDKIFDEDVKSYLLELGMEEKQIYQLRKKKVKEYAIFVLNQIIEAIEDKDLKSIQKYLCWSPAGDCMGENNTFINFGKIAGWDLDIEDLFQYLTDFSTRYSELIKGE